MIPGFKGMVLALALAVLLASPPVGPAHADSGGGPAGLTPDVAGAPIPEARLKDILSEVKANFSRIRTLKTRLIQEKHLSLFSEPVMSRGALLFKAPGKIRLEFSEPFESILLVSGDTIARFEAFNGQWQRMAPGDRETMGMILDHIASWVTGEFNRENLYTVSGRYRENGGPKAFTIILEPRAEAFRNFVRAFELGIPESADRLEFIIIRESGEDFTLLKFHDDSINTPLDESCFDGDRFPPVPLPQW